MKEKILQTVLALAAQNKIKEHRNPEKGPIYNYKMALFLLSSRSLMPQEKGVGFQFLRLKEEMALFPYYQQGLRGLYTDEHILRQIFPYVMLPLILANEELEPFIESTADYFLFAAGDWTGFFEGYFCALQLFLSFNQKRYFKEHHRERLKEGLMGLNYERLIHREARKYKKGTMDAQKQDQIAFERAKILALSWLWISDENAFPKVALFFSEGERAFEDFYDLAETPSDGEPAPLFFSFSKYLYDLRKGRIEPSKLRYEERALIDIFEVQQKRPIVHPLLGPVVLQETKETNGIKYVHVDTKFGPLCFRKRIQ